MNRRPLARALALSIAFSTVLSSFALSSFANSPPPERAPHESPSSLDGGWQLDWDRSDSFEPVMKALEVSWFMRKMAGIAKVKIALHAIPESADCKECIPEMQIMMKTPISSNAIRVQLDGVARAGKDPRGRDTLDAYRWTDENALEMDRRVELPSGRQARLLETRRFDSKSDTLLSTLVVWVDDEQEASILRTFMRADD